MRGHSGRILSTSELFPSFSATLESHPGSLFALIQHGIFKQAVYIKRSAGGGHHAGSVAQDKEGIQATTTIKHTHTLSFFISTYFHTLCRHKAHMCICIHIHIPSLSKKHICFFVQIPKKHRLALKRLEKAYNLQGQSLNAICR